MRCHGVICILHAIWPRQCQEEPSENIDHRHATALMKMLYTQFAKNGCDKAYRAGYRILNAKRPEMTASGALAINRTNLHTAVTTRLRHLIAEGLIPPGARLTERVLCEQLPLSRTPFRQALHRLASTAP